MSDDLVKRANLAIEDMQGRVDATKLQVFQDCADRIEELEAKLAKAVEHIEWFISEDETSRGSDPMPELRNQTWDEINAYWIAHLDSAIAFVAELKGKADE